MIPITELARDYAGMYDTERQPKVYAELLRLLDTKDPLVVKLFETGDVVLYEGYEYRVTETGYLELKRILAERRL